MKIRFKKLTQDAKTPTRATQFAAGMDIYVNYVEWDEAKRIATYHSGIALELPIGYFADLRARSSAVNSGQILSNGAGVIDSDYRGEIIAKFYLPFGYSRPYEIGERFAQLVITSCLINYEMEEAEELSGTTRGTGGFGSTGK